MKKKIIELAKIKLSIFLSRSLMPLLKVPTQKSRFNLYKNQISKTNFKSFPNQCPDFFFLHVYKISFYA